MPERIRLPQSQRRIMKPPLVRSREQVNQEFYRKIVEKRSQILTQNLIALFAAISCLSPFVSLHLSQRIGLLLFESDILLLRSSLINVIVCLPVLLLVHILFIHSSRRGELRNSSRLPNRNLESHRKILQKILKSCTILFSLLSGLAYLSIPLIVPQVRQIQRMPTATFDCNANLITIENCEQQFTSKRGSEQSLREALHLLLLKNFPLLGETDQGESQENKLLRKLECLRYNDKESRRLMPPTRFFLHNCGLVCRPHQQQVHQFGDDLNKDQQDWRLLPADQLTRDGEESSSSAQASAPRRPLHAPYDQHNTFSSHSNGSSGEQKAPQNGDQNQLSLKVCFSNELSTGSNYKQFCITQLNARSNSKRDQQLTVGQLNAMLRSFKPEPNQHSNSKELSLGELDSSAPAGPAFEDRTTHYMNPVVQFESHFKNWPHLAGARGELSSGPQGSQAEDAWCRFKPIPPFIINNKPFSDIQCSLEHEYTLATLKSGDNIYLRKSLGQAAGNEVDEAPQRQRERCNIQCKVNILYQVKVKDSDGSRRQAMGVSSADSEDSTTKAGREKSQLHYYLPLKPCVIVTNAGDKFKTSDYYFLSRSLGDSSLILVIIFTNALLVLETIQTKRSLFEAKRKRLFGVLSILIIIPLKVAFLLDLVAIYSPYESRSKSRDSFLTHLIYEHMVPNLFELLSLAPNRNSRPTAPSEKLADILGSSSPVGNATGELGVSTIPLVLDSYMVPFFAYAVCMFILAMSALSLPPVNSISPLFRMSSSEELGLAGTADTLRINKGSKQSLASDKRTGKPPVKVREPAENPIGRKIKNYSLISQRKFFEKLESNKRNIRMISLLLVTLFTGLQFNLAKLSQAAILEEALKSPIQLMGQHQNSYDHENYQTVKFVLKSKLPASLLLLLAALVFSSEWFSLGGNNSYNAFEQYISREEEQLVNANFLRQQALCMLVFALRSYGHSSLLTSDSNLSLLLIALFNLADFFNTYVGWLSIYRRLQHLFRVPRPVVPEEMLDSSSERHADRGLEKMNLFEAHMLAVLIVAFVWLALGRFLALFVNSLHASFYLHSDNVDWHVSSNQPQRSSANSTVSQRKWPSRNTTADESAPMSLFSPLPSERQSYLHASRTFLKHNSLVCLLVASLLLLSHLYFRYQIWAEQKRTLNVRATRGAAAAGKAVDGGRKLEPIGREVGTSGLLCSMKSKLCSLAKLKRADCKLAGFDAAASIEERLARDLMKLHVSSRNNTRLVYPGTSRRQAQQESSLNASDLDSLENPKAKILFRYNLDRRHNDSSSSSSDSSSLASHLTQMRVQERARREELAAVRSISDEEDHSRGQVFEAGEVMADSESSSSVVEKVVRLRNKRVRIFEDEEEWEDEMDSSEERAPEALLPNHVQKASLVRGEQVVECEAEQASSKERKRTISFAPTTTLIAPSNNYSSSVSSGGQSWEAGRGPISKQTTCPPPKHTASPEPSIGSTDGDDYADYSSHESIDNFRRH